MKKRFIKLGQLLATPFVCVWQHGFIAMLNKLGKLLNGRDTLKEEFRKAGWGLTGIGVTGTLVNGKALAYLVVLGITLWLLGLFDNLEEEDDDG